MHVVSGQAQGTPTDAVWTQTSVVAKGDVWLGFVVRGEAENITAAKEVFETCIRVADTIDAAGFLTLFSPTKQLPLDIAAICIDHDRVLIYTQGHVRIWLARASQAGTIAEGKPVGAYIEGKLQARDYYIFGTNQFFSTHKDIDPKHSPDHLMTEINEVLASDLEAAKVGAIAVADMPVEAEPVKPAVTEPEPSVRTPVRQRGASVADRFKRSNMRLSVKPLPPRMVRIMVRLGIAVGVLILAVLLISNILQASQQRRLNATMKPYTERYEKAKSQASSNRLDALTQLRDLRTELTARKQDSTSRLLTREYDKLLTLVQNEFSALSGEKHIDKLQVFYDFRLVAPDFVASSIGYDVPGKLAVFLDTTRSRALSLSLEKKEAQVLSVDERLSGSHALSIENRKAFVLGDNGVLELSLPLDKNGSIIIPKADAWQSPKLIGTFGTNLYILDVGQRNLFRYDLDDPTAEPTGWVKNKEGLEFNDITSLSIDGSVWFGMSNGDILLYTQGSQESFVLKEVLDLPKTSVSLYTTIESESLYILEPRAKRLLVVSKDGTYKKAVTSDDFGTATGLLVDESTQKAYVLAGSLVYEVPLN